MYILLESDMLAKQLMKFWAVCLNNAVLGSLLTVQKTMNQNCTKYFAPKLGVDWLTTYQSCQSAVKLPYLLDCKPHDMVLIVSRKIWC